MSVELDLTDDEAKFIWCRMQRGRDGIAAALKDYRDGELGDLKSRRTLHATLADLAYYFAALDTDLQRLARSAPEDIRPDGNESDKP